MTIRPRLYLLDTFRGLASLSVVIWHYQHFFSTEAGILSPAFALEKQPFFDVLELFYRHGHEAVPVFFTLSGFVLFATYYESISSAKLSAWKFAALRFSRLYPLHLATLLFVAIAQQLSSAIDGRYIIFEFNDWWHFALQMLFASHWGMQSGFSFNGPIWSVSIEIALYALFFALTFGIGQSSRNAFMAVLAMFCLSGLLRLAPGMRELSHPAACFFLGGVAYVVWNAVRNPIQQIVLAITSAATGIAAFLAYAHGWPHASLLHFAAFPAVVIFLATVQLWLPTAGRSTRAIGDITYATYLIHTPIQISVLLAAKYFGLIIDFYSPVVFIIFFCSVILISVPIYHCFELPMQQLCRRSLLGEAPTLKTTGDAPLFCRRRSWSSRPVRDRRTATAPQRW
jgi:peptidoglycan/LPS O-acetylase OafA/YrhL